MRMTEKNLNVIQWHLMILEAQQPIILDYIKDPQEGDMSQDIRLT